MGNQDFQRREVLYAEKGGEVCQKRVRLNGRKLNANACIVMGRLRRNGARERYVKGCAVRLTVAVLDKQQTNLLELQTTEYGYGGRSQRSPRTLAFSFQR